MKMACPEDTTPGVVAETSLESIDGGEKDGAVRSGMVIPHVKLIKTKEIMGTTMKRQNRQIPISRICSCGVFGVAS
jgi:hypothetical protein